MAPKKKELGRQLRDLRARHDELADAVSRLATHAAVLAVAVRDREAVPPGDLDAALAGIDELAARLVARSSPTTS